MSAPTTFGLRIRALEVSDLPFARETLRAFLPGGFFADLGDAFLSTYLRTYATSPSGCALIAESAGRPVGFLVGSVDRDSYRHHVLHAERWKLLVKGIIGLALRPRLAVQFVRTRLRRYLQGMQRRAPGSPATSVDTQVGVLAHIAVVPEARGTGVGKALMMNFLSVCAAHGTPRVRLYVGPSNTGAQSFYRANGWAEVARQADADGVPWIVMEVVLPASVPLDA